MRSAGLYCGDGDDSGNTESVACYDYSGACMVHWGDIFSIYGFSLPWYVEYLVAILIAIVFVAIIGAKYFARDTANIVRFIRLIVVPALAAAVPVWGGSLAKLILSVVR